MVSKTFEGVINTYMLSRPMCKECNRHFCAVNYIREGVRHYRSLCDHCGKKKKKAKQLTPEIAERAAVLANLKKQIATAKVNAQRAATIKAQEKIEEGN